MVLKNVLWTVEVIKVCGRLCYSGLLITIQALLFMKMSTESCAFTPICGQCSTLPPCP